MSTTRFILLSIFAMAGAQASAECRQDVFESVPMTVCAADPTADDLRLWWASDDAVLGTFERVRALLAKEGKDLGFAMNGGMYHDDRSPVGHYLDPNGQAQSIITNAGPGNFGMLPNGVFCIGEGWASVIESRTYAADPPGCRYATQSGPLLVIDGELHKRFIPDSDSRFIRNGVGVTDDGIVVAAISDKSVNFHRFARYFRDVLNTPNALYFDGNVSRLYAPELGRHDAGFPMGPIFGTVVAPD